MIGELIKFLQADPAVYALVNTRITKEWITQGSALPALTLETAGGDTKIHVDGTKQLRESLYQVDCWGRTAEEVHALRDAVMNILNGYVGDMGDVRVAISLNVRENDVSDLEGDRKTRRISLDFDITHEE